MNTIDSALWSIERAKELALFSLDIRFIANHNPETLKTNLSAISLGPYEISNHDRDRINPARASHIMEMVATQNLLVATDSAVELLFKKERLKPGSKVYLDLFVFIRCLRNAFSHNPFDPRWALESSKYRRKLQVTNGWEIDLTEKDGKPVTQQSYGYLSGIIYLSDVCSQLISAMFQEDSKHDNRHES